VHQQADDDPERQREVPESGSIDFTLMIRVTYWKQRICARNQILGMYIATSEKAETNWKVSLGYGKVGVPLLEVGKRIITGKRWSEHSYRQNKELTDVKENTTSGRRCTIRSIGALLEVY
jgi:hypothetical protein